MFFNLSRTARLTNFLYSLQERLSITYLYFYNWILLTIFSIFGISVLVNNTHAFNSRTCYHVYEWLIVTNTFALLGVSSYIILVCHKNLFLMLLQIISYISCVLCAVWAAFIYFSTYKTLNCSDKYSYLYNYLEGYIIINTCMTCVLFIILMCYCCFPKICDDPSVHNSQEVN